MSRNETRESRDHKGNFYSLQEACVPMGESPEHSKEKIEAVTIALQQSTCTNRLLIIQP